MMKASDIADAIKEAERNRASRVTQMRNWEKLWTLDFWSAQDKAEALTEGRELDTSIGPRNAIILAQWLITSDVQFRSMPEGESNEEVANQDARERFLKALWYQQSHIHEIHPVDAVKWHLLVHGEAVLHPTWVWHLIPEGQKIFVPPVNMRALSPLNCAFQRGAYGVEFGFHRYCEAARSVAARYPDAKAKIMNEAAEAKTILTVTDFWWQDDDKVHNAILVNDTQVKLFKDTKYPFVPLIQELADPSPTEKSHMRGNSLVGHLLDNWSSRNLISSMELTAVRDHYWPSTNIVNENGEEIPDIERGRGAVNILPAGTQFIGDETSQPRSDLAAQYAARLDRESSQGAFPDALYGDSGQQRSALGFNGMTEAGQGRIRGFVKAMQRILERSSQLALCLVGAKAVGELDLYSYNDIDDVVEPATIGPDAIGKRKAVHVIIKDQVASDKLQLMVGALQLFDRGIVSGRTVLEDYAPKDPREDEYARIVEEQVKSDPNLIREHVSRVWEERTGTPYPAPPPDLAQQGGGGPGGQPPTQPQGAQTDAVIPELQAGAQTGGQLTPESLTGDAQVDALINQMIMTGQVATPEQAIQLLVQGG